MDALNGNEHPTTFCLLHFDQLWLSVMVFFFFSCKEQTSFRGISSSLGIRVGIYSAVILF